MACILLDTFRCFRPRVLIGAVLVGGLVSAPAVGAQALVSLLPFEYEGDMYVTDSSADKVYRLVDLNLDGDYLDAGEVGIFYDDLVGPLALSNNSSVAVGQRGYLFVTDRGEGRILRMLDSDGDGKAESGGETTIFFDGNPLNNAGALDVAAPLSVSVDAQNVLWVGEADQGGVGKDSVLRLQDLNLDGDANDLGEAVRYFEPAMGSVPGDTILVDVFVGPDAFLYCVQGSTTGFSPVGIYRLNDADTSGVIDPVTEVTPFFLVPAGPFPIFLQAGALDGQGYMYLTDTGNDVVWRVRDENGDGTVDPVTEAKIFLLSPSSALVWDLAPTFDGRLLVSELNFGARLAKLDDANGDGSIDIFTELTEPYVASLAQVSMINPRGLAWDRRPTIFVPATVTTGTTGIGMIEATVGDTASIYFSTGLTAPLPLAPFGWLELDSVAPAIWGLLGIGIVPDFMAMPFNIPVPASPTLIGLAVYFQAFVGKPDRFEFSNVSSLTIQ